MTPNATPAVSTGMRRIASNSMLLFVRMAVVMVINLYAVRLVLNGLGIEDYGIYSAVAGLVGLSTFINGVLDIAIQRFYSFYLGKGETERVKETFTISIKIVVLLAIIVIALFETVGVWAVHTYLVFPIERTEAVMICYQLALLTFTCSLLRIPFTASIFAYEQMNWYAGISMAECLLRLAAAIALAYVALDTLVFYSCAYGAVAVAILLVYVIYCKRKHRTCSWVKTNNRQLAKEIFTFSGWNFFGAISKVGMIQGTMVLLNIFFGPIITAAFAIAAQIQNAFNAFTNAIVLAVRPPMIKAYAENSNDYVNRLFNITNKGLFYALLLVAVPLVSEMDTVLNIWLGQTDNTMTTFGRLIIVYVVILAMNNPITIIIHATGRIKRYVAYVESICLTALPIEAIICYLHATPYTVIVALITLTTIAHIARIRILKQEYKHFDNITYIKQFILPAIAITVAITAIAIIIHIYTPHTTVVATIRAISLAAITAIAAYSIALNRQEREIVATAIKNTKIGRLCGSKCR